MSLDNNNNKKKKYLTLTSAAINVVMIVNVKPTHSKYINLI